MKVCTHCGKTNDDIHRFCIYCGSPLQNEPQNNRAGQHTKASEKAQANPYAKPAANPYAKPAANPYAKPAANPYAKPEANPYAKPAASAKAQPAGNMPPAVTAPGEREQESAALASLGEKSEAAQNAAQSSAQSPEEKKAKKKKTKIWLSAVACVCVLAILIASIGSLFNRKPYMLWAAEGENVADFKDDVQLLDPAQAEKGLTDIAFDDQTQEYTIYYKSIPEQYRSLKEGDVFVVPSCDTSKRMQFNLGFSGKVSEIGSDFIRFSIPDFDQLFDKFSLDSGSVGTKNLKFIPEEGVRVEQEDNDLHCADIGLIGAKTDKVSIGDFSFDQTYMEPDKQSQLQGYDIIAKKLSLKIAKKSKTADDEAIEISGKLALEYPAVKIKIDFDGDDVKDYDVGFITKQSFSLNIKGTKTVNFLEPDLGLVDHSIIKVKDTYEQEPGKVVLGSYIVGAYLPLLENKHQIPYLGIGFVFQVCLTATGKITIECNASQTSFLQIESNAKKENTCLVKNSKYPNPVLGETGVEGQDYDTINMKTSVKGKMDFTAALSLDVGFAVLGTVPVKLANDVPQFRAVTTFAHDSTEKADIAQDLILKATKNVSRYELKLQSILRFNMGLEFSLLGVKADVGEIGFSYKVWDHTLMAFPKKTDFSIKECDFGGIQLGKAYTHEQMNQVFYDKLGQKGKSSLVGRIKDVFIQSTVNTIANKLDTFDINDLLDILPIEGDFDVVCYSEGALYFLEGGVVKAQLLTGEYVFNRSDISAASSSDLFDQVYTSADRESSMKISIGKIGIQILNAVGMSEIAKYDGTDLTIYEYNQDTAHMQVVFSGGGDPVFVVTYLTGE